MGRRSVLLFLCIPALACDPGPAPPGGTYLLHLEGDERLQLSQGDAGTITPFSVDSTAALYVDVGAGGQDPADVWAVQGFNPPRSGRLFEMRLFPYTFEGDGSTTTLAGVFKGDIVEAVGLASGSASYVSVQFAGDDAPTLCAYYEQRREVYLQGTWAGDAMTVTGDVLYQELCLDPTGAAVKNGYPAVTYDLTGTLEHLYDPFTAPEAP